MYEDDYENTLLYYIINMQRWKESSHLLLLTIFTFENTEAVCVCDDFYIHLFSSYLRLLLLLFNMHAMCSKGGETCKQDTLTGGRFILSPTAPPSGESCSVMKNLLLLDQCDPNFSLLSDMNKSVTL